MVKEQPRWRRRKGIWANYQFDHYHHYNYHYHHYLYFYKCFLRLVYNSSFNLLALNSFGFWRTLFWFLVLIINVVAVRWKCSPGHIWINFTLWKPLNKNENSKGWVTHVTSHSRTQSVIMTLGVRVSLMTFWNSEKSSSFKVHELSWPIIEFCTGILRLPNSCPAIAHIYRWTLWKNHPSVVFISKENIRQAARQRKLEISSCNIQL